MAAIECPANYFGKGEDYNLPDDVNVIAEYERKWKEWEAAHPEDPTGEIALADAKKKGNLSTPTITSPNEEVKVKTEDDIDCAELQLLMPVRHIQLLKNYAKFRRRRPRDIIMGWIDMYAKL